jgi:hypothetical protein
MPKGMRLQACEQSGRHILCATLREKGNNSDVKVCKPGRPSMQAALSGQRR